MIGGRLTYIDGKFVPSRQHHPIYVDIEAKLLNELNIIPQDIHQSIDFNYDSYLIKSGLQQGNKISLIDAIRDHLYKMDSDKERISYKERWRRTGYLRDAQDEYYRDPRHSAFTRKLKDLVIDRINSRLTSSHMPRRNSLRDNVTSSSLDKKHPYPKRQKTSKGKNKKKKHRSRTKYKSKKHRTIKKPKPKKQKTRTKHKPKK